MVGDAFIHGRQEKMKTFSISVVVPAYNCQNTIAHTLKAIQNQTINIDEIIVVDDGSVDQGAAVIKKFQKVKYIFQNNSGPAGARNRGAQEARGEIIFFTDSDCVPRKDWVEKSLPHFQDSRVGVVAGSYGIANSENILARCIHKEILYRHHHLMPQYPKAFGSYNFGVRKKVFEEVGGFNTVYPWASGEDNDLSYKILNAGHKIYFEKNSLVDHYHTIKVFKYLQEQYRHGVWRVQMYRDHPMMMKGDGYTFWKDIIEVPLVFGVCWGALFLFLFLSVQLVAAAILILMSLEIVFAFLLTKNIFEAVFYSFVMFLRSFARTFGFSSGILHIRVGKA